MFMSMSYPTTIHMVDELAKDHDKEVLEWKESLYAPSQVSTAMHAHYIVSRYYSNYFILPYLMLCPQNNPTAEPAHAGGDASQLDSEDEFEVVQEMEDWLDVSIAESSLLDPSYHSAMELSVAEFESSTDEVLKSGSSTMDTSLLTNRSMKTLAILLCQHMHQIHKHSTQHSIHLPSGVDTRWSAITLIRLLNHDICKRAVVHRVFTTFTHMQ